MYVLSGACAAGTLRSPVACIDHIRRPAWKDMWYVQNSGDLDH
jgi:hypothetical protein